MKYCRNCSEELAKDAKFCKRCGFDLTNKSTEQKETKENNQKELYTRNSMAENSGRSNNENNQSHPASKTQLFQLTTKAKVLFGLAAALIIFLFVGFKIGESMASYEKKIEKFEAAIHENDAKALANLLTPVSKGMKVDKDSVSGLIEFYKEYPSEMNDIIRHLKDQGNDYDENPESDMTFDYDYGYYPINLIKSGKTFIFDHYDIQVSPVYFNVYTNYENAEILLDGEVVGTASSDDYSKEFGPYLPGTYTFSAKYSSEFIDLETETVHTNFDPGYVSDVDLYLEANNVYFDLYYTDREAIDVVNLLINGEDTGINLMEQDEVGPLPTDGSIEVSFVGEFPWGTMRSDTFILDSDYMDVTFSVSEELAQLAQEKIIQYNKEYLEAYTTVDSSVFTVASDHLIEDVIADATYDKDWDYEYSGKFIGIDFYEEAFDMYYIDNNWYVAVGTNTILEETSFGSSDLEVSNREMTYELKYDKENDDWSIDNVGYGAYMTKETEINYRDDDPKTYSSVWSKEK